MDPNTNPSSVVEENKVPAESVPVEESNKAAIPTVQTKEVKADQEAPKTSAPAEIELTAINVVSSGDSVFFCRLVVICSQ